MIAGVVERPNLTLLSQLTAPAAPAQLPPVVDKAAQKASVARAFELGLALERRFQLALAGKGSRVDSLPAAELARDVRVGDGTPFGMLGNVTKRALFIAAPLSVGLLTAFGAAEASDLALVIAGVAPFTWVPAAAVRSLRAERAARREAKRAAAQVSTEHLEPIETFVPQVAGYKDPHIDAVARAMIDHWIKQLQRDNGITTAAADKLAALRSELPQPAPDVVALGERLINLGRLARSLAREAKIVASHVDIVKHALAGCTGLERDAITPTLQRMLVNHVELLKLVPDAKPEPAPPLSVTFAKDEVVAK